MALEKPSGTPTIDEALSWPFWGQNLHYSEAGKYRDSKNATYAHIFSEDINLSQLDDFFWQIAYDSAKIPPAFRRTVLGHRKGFDYVLLEDSRGRCVLLECDNYH